MFSRFSIFTKFLVLASTLFAILAAVFIVASSIIIRNSFIDRSKLAVGSAIQFETKDLQPQDFSLKDPKHAESVFNNLYNKVKSTEIIRIKVWDYSAKVIFSDDKSIVGQRFADNKSFKEAILSKEPVTEIGAKTKPENVSELGYKQLLEVYVPITFKGETVPSGVIEAYFKLDDVNSRIRETQLILITTIVAFSLVSFGLLFIVFKMIIYKQIERINLQAVALDNASDHVIIADPDGIISYVNKAAEKLTGYSKSEMIGSRPSLWGKRMPKKFYEKMWKTIKVDKKDFEGQITNRRKNGEEYEALIKISPVFDKKGSLSFFVGIERDITKEKAVDKAKTEFVSLASHQLRTPLSAVNWYSEMLLAGDAGKLNNEQKKYLDEVYKSNQRMVELVNALLNVSRMELGTFIVEPEPTDVVKLAQSVIDEQKSQIDAKKIELSESLQENIPLLQVDPAVLRMVVQNLLSNAVKYTPDKGKVSFDLRLVKSGESIDNQQLNKDSLVVVVSDTGMGIPKEVQDKIFTKLFRADNVREKNTEGTGLGLYIVKSIVEHSGGKVWFTSEENKGTTFYVVLPLAEMKMKEGTKALE